MAEVIEINKGLVLINSVSSVLTRLIKITVLVWLHQYLVKRVNTDEYSVLAVLMTLMMFVPLFTTILSSGLSRFTVEAYARNDQRRIVQIVSTMLPLLALAALLLLIIAGCFVWQMDHILNFTPERLNDARIMMMMMVGLLALQLVLGPFGQGLYVKQKFVLMNLIRLSGECLRITLLFIFLFGISTKVIWVVFASVAADLTVLILIVILSRHYLPMLKFDRREIHWPAARELTSFGIWNTLSQISDKMGTGAGTIILNLFSTAVNVNYFYLGTLFLRNIQMFEYRATQPLMPVLTAMHAQQSRDRLRNAYLRGGRIGLWTVLLLVVPLMIYRREVITLWLGQDFLMVATIMCMMLVLFPIQYGHVMVPKLSIATGRIRPWALRTICIQVANVGLTLYLVGARGMGAMGAALSWVIILVIGEVFLMIPLGLKLADVRLNRWIKTTIIPGVVPALVSALVWLGLQNVIQPQSLWTLSFCVFPGLLVYVIILLLCCLQNQDRKDLVKVLEKYQWLRTRFQWFAKRQPKDAL